MSTTSNKAVNWEEQLPNSINESLTSKLSRELADTQSRLAIALKQHEQSERQLSVMFAVSKFLAEATKLSDAVPRILKLICQEIQWDLGAIWMVDDGGELLRCVESWHDSMAAGQAFSRASRKHEFSYGMGLPGKVWASGAPIWIRDVTCDSGFIRGPDAARDDLHAAVALPLKAGGEFLGVIEFFSHSIRQPEEALLALLNSISGQVSEFVERRRMTELLRQQSLEHRLAKEIQLGLLPKAIFHPAGLTFCGRSNLSNNVGGDYFDYFLMTDGSVGIVIGDASGHGIGAALMIAETRAYLRALALTSNNPAEILTFVNQRLAQDLSSGFVTLLLARVDTRACSLQFAGAGHCPGYVIGRNGEIKATLTSEGLPLGIDTTFCFPAGPVVSLESGDLLFLYTDGLIEAGVESGNGLFGIERALRIVRSHYRQEPREILDALLIAVNDFSGNCTQMDDITVLLVRV